MHYLDLTIKEIHEALVSKKVTPLELVLESIKRAEADTNNCFEFICKDEAIEFAKSLGEPEVDNYLWGIPYLLKDNFSTKALVNCLPHIEKAYRMHCSNVVFSYILDNLLFNILKEKFLCKQ